MTDQTHDVKMLNSLLATVVDSIDGFKQATDASDTARFNAVFNEVAADRRGIANDIESQIRSQGGTPEEEGTLLGSAHRVLIKLRDMVSSGDVAVVDEAERGEDYIKGKFRKAAEDADLTPKTRSFVTELSARVRAGHDRIRDLKHALHGEG